MDNQIHKITVNLTNNLVGNGYRTDEKEYISIREIGRQLHYKGQELKDFTKWVTKQKQWETLIHKELVENKTSYTPASVIMATALPHIMPFLINKRNSKKTNLSSYGSLVNELKNFHGKYIIIESFQGYMLESRLYSEFNLPMENSNLNRPPKKISYKDFVLFCFEHNLYSNYQQKIIEIIKEFDHASNLSAEGFSEIFNSYIPQ